VNSRTAFIAVAVALLLSAGVYFLSRERQAPTPPSLAPVWLQTLEPGKVIGLDVAWGGDMGRATVEPSGLSDIWLLRMKRGGTADEVWPVSASRVRATVRLVAELVGSSLSDDVEAGQSGTSVTFRLRDGTAGTLLVHDAILAGRGWVTLVGDSSVTIATDSSFVKLFRPEGLLAWREASPIVAAPGDTFRLAIDAGDLKVELTRVAGHWGLTVPASTHADPKFTEAALSVVHSLKVKRFLSATEVADFQPNARIVAQMKALDGRTLVQTAEIGQAADAAASGAFVRAQASWEDDAGKQVPAWGPCSMVVERASIEKLTADPRAFAGKTPSNVPAADVIGIQVGSATFRRELKGWSRDSLLVDEATTKKVASLLDVLCEKPAPSCTFSVPEGWSPIVAVAISGSRGLLDSLELGTGNGAAFVRRGDVFRQCNEVALVQWAASLK
jgi:hypothetical protein